MRREDAVLSMVISPDGRWLATTSNGRTVRIWDTDTGREVASMIHRAEVFGDGRVVFSPNGHLLVTGIEDGIAWVWDIAARQIAVRMAHEDSLWAVVFSPDGQLVATASYDYTARVWETVTGREIARIEHNDKVIAVAFSPDSRWLATASEDGTARVCEAATGREVDWMEHEGGVEVVAFSPDGKWLATGGDDGMARVWPWRPEDLIAEACTRLPCNLALEEWRQYIGDEPYRPTCPNLLVPEG